MVQSTTSGRADNLAAENVVNLPRTAPPRPRGRRRKPTHETPCTATFDAVAAVIKAIPPDERATAGKVAKPGRNAARDRARAAVGRDHRLARSAIVVFNCLLDELRWHEGRCCHSLQWFADKCRLKRNTVTRAFKALKAAGYILRRQKERCGRLGLRRNHDPHPRKTWEEMSAGVGPNNAEVGPEKAGVGPRKYMGWVRVITTAL